MPYKVSSFCIVVFLLLSFTLAYAIRPEPTFAGVTSPGKTQSQVVGVENDGDVNCDGVGEEECLMRRTLAAHVDYIYTQKHKP
ncbi:hypothetical protein Tsubulata_004297 [Turnera subulata]|uniref:Phytosulfokine n=1 Tax=Turnera subulata TaxID=218843 RepID=A0A9Q0F5B2_9ROSI|nr:hypothetical protein Tsubulata_004297 [Turnera subulata]